MSLTLKQYIAIGAAAILTGLAHSALNEKKIAETQEQLETPLDQDLSLSVHVAFDGNTDLTKIFVTQGAEKNLVGAYSFSSAGSTTTHSMTGAADQIKKMPDFVVKYTHPNGETLAQIYKEACNTLNNYTPPKNSWWESGFAKQVIEEKSEKVARARSLHCQ